MGSFSNGVYVPAIGEVGWGTNVNDFLTRSGEEYINVKQSPYAAVGDGSHDDTAAFTAAATAAGEGGTIFVPPGTYVLADWAPASTVHVVGSALPKPGGSGGTTLKAKAGATWVVKLLGFYTPTIRNLQINGNGRASSGVLVQGTGSTTTSQGVRFEDVEFYRCDVGVKLDASSWQTDKNLFSRVRMDECLTGIWLNSDNTQFTQLQEVSIGANIGVRMSGGTLLWLSGGCTNSVGGSAQGILVDSAAAKFITLIDWIDEYTVPAVSIDGTTNWPVQGVSLEHSVLTGSTATVKIGTNSGHLYARETQFASGNVIAVANDTLFVEESCLYVLGAAWTQTGANNRRIQTVNNGIFYYFNNTSTPLSSLYVTGEIQGKLATSVKAGTPVDGDYFFPVNGQMAIDSSTNRLYARVGGVWKWVALT